MKILQIIQKPQLRGAEIFACQLSNHLIDAGHDVTLLSLFPGTATLPFTGTLIRLDRPISKRMFDFTGWKQLGEAIHELSPDIVQANAGDTLKFASISRIIFGWKAKLVFRNANKVSDFVDSQTKKLFNRLLLKQVSHVISVSELCRQDFVRLYSYPSSCTTTVAIGIETNDVERSDPDDLRAWVANDPLIVNVGSLVPEKNQAALLRLMKYFKANGKSCKLLIVGDGKLRGDLQHFIESHNLMDCVKLAGYRSDAIRIIASADIFALPSLIEGLPGVILEAMYCRTPVVAYDVGGIAEIITDRVTGRLISKGDEPAFFSAVEEILHCKPAEMISAAFENVKDNFNNTIITERFAAVYKRISS